MSGDAGYMDSAIQRAKVAVLKTTAPTGPLPSWMEGSRGRSGASKGAVQVTEQVTAETARDAYLRTVRVPWEELEETYREVVATGSQRAVAIAHGWTQAKVRHRVMSYMKHAGIEGDPPGIISRDHAQRGSMSHSGLGDRTEYNRTRRELREVQARLDAIETENAALRLRLAEAEDIRSAFAALHRKLDRIEKALAPTPVVVTHRRITDGGRGGKRERRPRPMAIPA